MPVEIPKWKGKGLGGGKGVGNCLAMRSRLEWCPFLPLSRASMAEGEAVMLTLNSFKIYIYFKGLLLFFTGHLVVAFIKGNYSCCPGHRGFVDD